MPYISYVGMRPLAPIPEEEGPVSLLCNPFVAPFLAPEAQARPVEVSGEREDSPLAAVCQLFSDAAESSQAERLRAAAAMLEVRPEPVAQAVAARLKSAALAEVMSEVAASPKAEQAKAPQAPEDEEEEIKDPKLALRRKLDPHADERRVKTEACMDADAVIAGGQRELGVEPDGESFWAVLRVQERLREHGLLRNLLQRRLQEIYRPSGNVSQQMLDARLDAARGALKDLTSSPAAIKRFGFAKEEVERIQAELRLLSAAIDNYGSQDAPLQLEVYESDPVSLKQTSFTLTEQCYRAVFQNTDQCLRIYIARSHPNWAEALVYCWLRAARFAHNTCLLIETLLSTRRDRHLPVATPMISDRVYEQLAVAPYRQLACLVQSTAAGLQLPATPAPSGLLGDIVTQVREVCVYRLTKEIDERKRREEEDKATLAKEVPRDDLALLLLRAMWLEYVAAAYLTRDAHTHAIRLHSNSYSFAADLIARSSSCCATCSCVCPRLRRPSPCAPPSSPSVASPH